MALTLDVPDGYGFALVAACSTFFVNFYHVILTSQSRKASGIKYPAAYASEEQASKDANAYKFNCAQRAHANFTENHPSVLAAILISGLRFPTLSGVLGVSWAACRVIYAAGYTGSGPAGRARGSLGGLVCGALLQLCASYVASSIAFRSLNLWT